MKRLILPLTIALMLLPHAWGSVAHYINNVANQGGRPVAGASVTVYNTGTLVKAHPGEEIINPQASARNRPLLKAINRGDEVSSGSLGETYHVTINAVDASSFRDMLMNRGGIKVIARAIRRAQLEGGW
jgi:hypothetical protein